MLEHIGAELSRSHAALRARARRRSAWIAHLQTCRPYTLAYPGLVGLAGAALAGQTVPVRLAAVWCAVTSGWLAGHYIGDFCDRDLDAIAKPQRPIPSGRLGPDEVLAAGVACAAGCVAAAALARPVAAAPAALIVAGIVAYSGFLKARGLAGNLIRGLLTSLAFALGAFSTGSFPVLLLPFAGAIAVHDCASNIVGTLRDMEGDRAGGFSTLPVRHGAGPATAVAAGCYTCAIALAAAGLWLQHRSSVPYALVAVAAVMGARAFWLLVTGPRPIPAPLALRSHAVLVLERIVLAGALLAAGAGPAAGLLLAVPLTAVSYLAQARMRAGHELPPHEGTP